MIRDNDLRSKPSSSSDNLGKLPTGTIGIYKGKKNGPFLLLEVELEDGRRVEGWVEQTSVEVDNSIPVAPVIPTPSPSEEPTRVRIPEDEALLLRRESSFLYGAHAGGNYALMDAEGYTYGHAGFGFTAGGQLGIFLSSRMPLRFEVSVSQLNGISDQDNLNLSFTFLDLAIVPAYQFNRTFELFAGFHYAMGMGIADIPNGLDIPSAFDLSSLALQAGAAIHFPMGQGVEFILKGRYTYHFLQYPIAFQSFGIIGAIEVRG